MHMHVHVSRPSVMSVKCMQVQYIVQVPFEVRAAVVDG